jgi:hypothetical protein
LPVPACKSLKEKFEFMTMNQAPKKYALEVFQLNQNNFINACKIESDEPFLSIHTGDFLNPSTWNLYCLDNVESDYKEPSTYGVVLKVTGVEHSLVQKENGSISQHKISVYTLPVENNHAVLFSGGDDDGGNRLKVR